MKLVYWWGKSFIAVKILQMIQSVNVSGEWLTHGERPSVAHLPPDDISEPSKVVKIIYICQK